MPQWNTMALECLEKIDVKGIRVEYPYNDGKKHSSY